MEAGFCGGFVAQWFMTALVRHPGFESRSCRFFAFLLSLSAGWIPIKRLYKTYYNYKGEQSWTKTTTPVGGVDTTYV